MSDDTADAAAAADSVPVLSYQVICRQVSSIPLRPPAEAPRPLTVFDHLFKREAMNALRGFVRVTYDDLVRLFGEPGIGPDGKNLHGDTDGKILCKWQLQFQHGLSCTYTYATIYDWKEPCTPMDLYTWHVGGFDELALAHVWMMLEASLGRQIEKYSVEEQLIAVEVDGPRATAAREAHDDPVSSSNSDEDDF